MYILLASGARERYLDEVVRVLAIPSGAQINFRYKKKWLTGSVNSNMKKLIGANCLIGHISFHNSSSKITPLRYGKIADYKISGDFIVINFVAESYTKVTDNNEFQKELVRYADNIPQDPNGTGFFTYYNNSLPIKGVSIKDDNSYWEDTVKTLSKCDDFKKRAYNFFIVEGIFKSKNKKVISKDKFFTLNSGCCYEIVISFFNSVYNECRSSLNIESSSCVKFISSNICVFDTEYDTREIKIISNNHATQTYGYLHFDSASSICNSAEHTKTFAGIDFDLPIKVKGNTLYNITTAFVFGAAIFFASMKTNSVLPNDTSLFSAAFWTKFLSDNWWRMLASLLSGIVASFGIKKPFW